MHRVILIGPTQEVPDFQWLVAYNGKIAGQGKASTHPAARAAGAAFRDKMNGRTEGKAILSANKAALMKALQTLVFHAENFPDTLGANHAAVVDAKKLLKEIK